ncbi:MAG: PDZ domain-containing protein [Verrucomicrobiae bacterium]|nr:PDZ domain-containing protein [Verrucomicrobiae bacterium]NNJ42350.1 PDZ domain-containing protein [Akkermansiaceae bacterium]
MKASIHQHNRLMGVISLASLALVFPVSAIENPWVEGAPKEAGNQKEAAEQERLHDHPAGGEKAEKKRALLGLGGFPASEALSHHLGLDHGLTIYHVVPGSAAEKAEIEAHDVITEVQGQKIGSQQELRDAVLACKPGDQITVKYFHKGEMKNKNVVLGARSDQPRVLRAPRGHRHEMDGALRHFPKAERERIENLMQKQRQQFQKQLGNAGGMRLDLQQLMDGAPNDKAVEGGMAFKFGSAASVTMRDGDGSVTLKTIDGHKEVIVKDKEGEVVFEGPYQTDQDKAAVPDDIRHRLRRLDLMRGGKDGILRLNVEPGGIHHGDVPPPGAPEDEANE